MPTLSFGDDRSVASVMTGLAGGMWDDDASVTSEGVEAPLGRGGHEIVGKR